MLYHAFARSASSAPSAVATGLSFAMVRKNRLTTCRQRECPKAINEAGGWFSWRLLKPGQFGLLSGTSLF